MKSIAGPCTQYYNKMNEQESQLTAYKMQISQTQNQNLISSQQRKGEMDVAASAQAQSF